MLLNPAGKVFVGQRIDSTLEAWQMPQGGIDNGEDPETAARRELAEETGVAEVRILAVTRDWLTYDLPADLQAKLWGGQYRGQRQRWFAMRHLADDSAIDLDTSHPEFRAWMWVEPARLPGLAVPFKRALYEAVLAEFSALLG